MALEQVQWGDSIPYVEWWTFQGERTVYRGPLENVPPNRICGIWEIHLGTEGVSY